MSDKEHGPAENRAENRAEIRKVSILQESMERSNPMMAPSVSRILLNGTMERRGTGVILCYEENLSDDPDHPDMSRVHMHISAGRVMMMRTGSIQSTMVFERNHHYETRYMTPYGEMHLVIHTVVVETSLQEDDGSVHLEYQLFSDLGGEGTYRVMGIRFSAPRNPGDAGKGEDLFRAFAE